MDLIKKLFKIVVWGVLGLIVFSLAMSFLLAPSDEDMAKYREQERVQKQQEEEAIKARVRTRLKEEIEGNRAGVVQEINELMGKSDYLLAHRKADRFREFNDDEINQLSKTALARHEEAERVKKAQRDEAENIRKAQEERRFAAALQRMSKKTDKIEGIDWYRDKSSPIYNNQNGFFIYIGKRGSEAPWLRLRIQYYAEDWLFIESFIVVADGRRFERNGVGFERDNDSKIWEWYDESLSQSDLTMIRAVVNSKEAVIRFNGRQYRNDKTITAAQKAALQNVLDAFKALGGN